MKVFALFILFFCSLQGSEHYEFSPGPIDVVIPCSPKDKRTLDLCIESTRKYVDGVRRIIVISSEQLTAAAEWFDEAQFPFSKFDVAMELFAQDREKAAQFVGRPKSRIGWIYQQLLKLYAHQVIPSLSPNILVVDADVIWLKPVRFMTKKGEPIFITGKEFHKPYFDHLSRLLKGVGRVYQNYSGVAHHMLFQKPILEDLFEQILLQHKEEPWKAICHCIDPLEISDASFSEYEIYFNFALSRTDQCQLSSVKWKNCQSLEKLKKYQKKGYAYVAYHCSE